MRVHEFAKQSDVASKELLEALKAEGFEVKSHMAVLSEKELSFLSHKFKNKNKEEELVKVLEKTPASPKSSKIKEQPPMQEHAKNQEIAPVVFLEQPEEVVLEEQLLPDIKVEKSFERDPIDHQSMSLEVFVKKTKLPINDVILALLKQGKVYTKNSILPEDVVALLARYYEIPLLKKVSAKDRSMASGSSAQPRIVKKEGQTREPVVVVMGHVDHGKTTLLDYIRKTRVAAKEKGGITQHLGAYEVKTSHGGLVFLDTPGHEAFAKIRKRGISVADIVVLVIAADDGIMPQTVECIKIAKSLDATIIVAINKIDKADAVKIEIVKRQLAQHDLLPEEWGGDIMCVPISAKDGTGVDRLLEMIVLLSDMLELKAEQNIPAEGYILEARIQKGRGSLATVLCRQGVLKLGDYFKAGNRVGHVASLTNSQGVAVQKALPSVPVLVTGFEDLPPVGSLFEVITEAEYRKLRFSKEEAPQQPTQRSQFAHGEEKDKFNIILKADTYSSLEAILDAFDKIDKATCKQFVVVRSGIGEIRESDVILAQDTGAVIVGFHVKVEGGTQSAARQAKVSIHLFDIIYKLLEELEVMAAKAKEIKTIKTKIGEAEVLKVFDIKNLGVIAGCVVRDGRLSNKGAVIITRGRREVGTGKISSLQRDKKQVKEVHTGFECAFLVDGFSEWQSGDIVTCFLDLPSTAK